MIEQVPETSDSYSVLLWTEVSENLELHSHPSETTDAPVRRSLILPVAWQKDVAVVGIQFEGYISRETAPPPERRGGVKEEVILVV